MEVTGDCAPCPFKIFCISRPHVTRHTCRRCHRVLKTVMHGRSLESSTSFAGEARWICKKAIDFQEVCLDCLKEMNEKEREVGWQARSKAIERAQEIERNMLAAERVRSS